MKRNFLALSFGAAGLLMVGTSSMAVADQSAADANDKQEEDIRACFQQTPDLKNNRIDVKVEDGIAVLEGTVDTAKEKKEAQKLAHVEGILGVNNRLKVSGAKK